MVRALVALAVETETNYKIEFWSTLVTAVVTLLLTGMSLWVRRVAGTSASTQAMLLPCYYRIMYLACLCFVGRTILVGATGPYPAVPSWYLGANYVRTAGSGEDSAQIVAAMVCYILYWGSLEAVASTVLFVFFVAEVPTTRSLNRALLFGTVLAFGSIFLTAASFAGSLGSAQVTPNAQTTLDTVFLVVNLVPASLVFCSNSLGWWRMRPAAFPYAGFNIAWRVILLASVQGRMHGSIVGGITSIFRDVGLPLSVALALAQDTRFWQQVIQTAATSGPKLVDLDARTPKVAADTPRAKKTATHAGAFDTGSGASGVGERDGAVREREVGVREPALQSSDGTRVLRLRDLGKKPHRQRSATLSVGAEPQESQRHGTKSSSHAYQPPGRRATIESSRGAPPSKPQPPLTPLSIGSGSHVDLRHGECEEEERRRGEGRGGEREEFDVDVELRARRQRREEEAGWCACQELCSSQPGDWWEGGCCRGRSTRRRGSDEVPGVSDRLLEDAEAGAGVLPYGSESQASGVRFVSFDRIHHSNRPIYANEDEKRYVYRGRIALEDRDVAIKYAPLVEKDAGLLGSSIEELARVSSSKDDDADDSGTEREERRHGGVGTRASAEQDRDEEEEDDEDEDDESVGSLERMETDGVLLGDGKAEKRARKGKRRLQRIRPEVRLALRRHFAEAEILRFVSHRNVVELIAVSTDMERSIIVLEDCKGGSLLEYLHMAAHQGHPVPSRIKLRFAVHLAKAVRHLHYLCGDTGVLHRDIKPANILVREDLSLCIADFDLACFLEDTERVAVGQVGTYTHCAPEIFSGEAWTRAADIYAVGVVLWELWTERHAWSRLASPLDVEDAVCIDGKRPDSFNPRSMAPMSEAYEAIMQRCWAQSPLERPTALELVRLLTALADSPDFEVEEDGFAPDFKVIDPVLSEDENHAAYATFAFENDLPIAAGDADGDEFDD